MTTKLSDLFKLRDKWNGKPDTSSEYVQAEVSDLVEALQAEGVGEVRSLWSWSESGKRRIMEPGRFYVVPLGEDA